MATRQVLIAAVPAERARATRALNTRIVQPVFVWQGFARRYRSSKRSHR